MYKIGLGHVFDPYVMYKGLNIIIEVSICKEIQR